MRKPSKVQSVIIPKARFTKRQARAWVAEHGFIDPGVDETDDYYRFRQMDPDQQHFKYRTIPFGDSGVLAVVRVSRLPQLRGNPGYDDIIEAIRAARNEREAMQIAYPQALVLAHHLDIPVSTARGAKAMIETAKSVAQAVRSGVGGAAGGGMSAGAGVAAKVAAMPEVTQALEGTGLVPVALEQATQIAEVQTSQGVVDVPVVDASRFPQTARFLEEEAPVDDGDEDEEDESVAELARIVSEIVGFDVETRSYSGRGMFGKQSPFAFEASVWNSDGSFGCHPSSRKGKQLIRLGFTYDTLGTGMIWYLKQPEHLERAISRAHGDDEDEEEETSAPALSPFDEAVQAIDNARHLAQTATRREQTQGLRESVQQVLARLPRSVLKDVAAHYKIDLQRTPADRRAEKIIDFTVGWTLRGRAIRGDYEEDEEARVRERDEQMQRMIAAYRERHGLPPLAAGEEDEDE